MTPLQYRMLELVLEIDEICKRHDIIYYLAGGSVLGAVRHNGFIPWDDDIDIMMTRQEFAKFQKVCETEMRDDREIITMINTPCHTKVTIKYMNKTTSQFFRSQVLDTTGCGISLDIMILDPLPKDEEQKQQHIAEYVVYNELLTPFFMVNENLYKYVDMYNACYDRIQREGKDGVMNELYTRLFVDEPEESEYYLYRWGQQLLIYDRQLFGTPRYMDFEGYSLPVPSKTVDFLRATYGDTWIYLPAEQNRETHTSTMNPNIAYVNWLKDIQPFLNREGVLRDFVERKKLRVQNAVPAHDVAVYNYQQSALLIQLEFENDPGLSVDALARLGDDARIEAVRKYLRVQLSGGLIKNLVFADIGDDRLQLILNSMIRLGDYSKADKILRVRNSIVRPLTEELKRCVQLIADIRYCVRYFEDRRVDEASVPALNEIGSYLSQMLQAHPMQIDFHRCYLQYCILAGIDSPDAIAAAIASYPNDPEIAFWAGKLYLKSGNAEAAQNLFQIARTTSNGVILLEFKEMEGTSND